jgi:hypothetical protein
MHRQVGVLREVLSQQAIGVLVRPALPWALRRILAEVENNAKALRDRWGIFENQLLSVPAASWPEAAAKARYVLNLYEAGLAPDDTHHRDLVVAVLADFARLFNGR